MKIKALMTISELSPILGISKQAILKKIKTGALSAKKYGNYYLVKASVLNCFLNNYIQNQDSKKYYKRKGSDKYGR